MKSQEAQHISTRTIINSHVNKSQQTAENNFTKNKQKTFNIMATLNEVTFELTSNDKLEKEKA